MLRSHFLLINLEMVFEEEEESGRDFFRLVVEFGFRQVLEEGEGEEKEDGDDDDDADSNDVEVEDSQSKNCTNESQ